MLPDDPLVLSKQRPLVLNILLDKQIHTPQEIAQRTGVIPGSVSSRIRDLRLQQYGNYVIERIHMGGRVWGYQLKGVKGANAPAYIKKRFKAPEQQKRTQDRCGRSRKLDGQLEFLGI